MPRDTPYINASHMQPERGSGKTPSVWFRDDLRSSQEVWADFLPLRGHMLVSSGHEPETTPGTTAADIRPWPVILRPWFERQAFAPQAH